MGTEEFNSIMTGLNEALEYTTGDKSKGRSRIRETPLVIKPVNTYTKEIIKDLRLRLNLSQHSFAKVLGVSPKTVEAWETGVNQPSGSSARMIELMEKDDEILERFDIVVRKAHAQ